MNIKNYIAISVISHLLLMSIMTMVLPESRSPLSVLDVEIVMPEKLIEAVPPPEERVAEKEPPIVKKPLLKRRVRSKPRDENLKPDSLHAKDDPSADQRVKERTDEKASGNIGNIIDEAPSEMPSLVEKGLPLIPGSALFDRKTIEKFAKRNTPESTGLSFNTTAFKHRGYMRLLKEKIQSTWHYPKEAAKLGISGDLYIRFTIMKNGDLGKTEIVRTSGYRYLDRAAEKALKDAQPYWPLPDDWESDHLEITGHFIYLYGNIYVM